MNHPGPPRFTAVGSAVELAPRDPDPAATYRWTVVESPPGSDVAVGSDPVTDLVPDAPGTYRVELETPAETHQLTVRAYPATRERVEPSDEVYGEYAFDGPYAGERGDSGSDGGRPRVHLDGEIEGEEVVVRATPAAAPDSDLPDSALDVEFLADDRDGLDQRDLAVNGREARVPLAALDGPARVHAVAVGEEHSVADAVRVSAAGVERLNEVPAWAEDATVYEIYVRAFADGEDGSAFASMTDRLDHVADLGVDCIWLTPVLEKDDAEHGYNITDFFEIAADLGSRDDFEAFVDACHDRDIRVLFDLVLNHSARQHPYFERAVAGDPEYRDWYEWDDEDADEPASYFDWHKVANFNVENLEVRRHLLDAVDEWAPLVDGFRCDMAWALPHGFWKEIRERVHATEGDQFLFLDETIPYAADFSELEFDVHFDTTLYFNLRQVGRGHEPAEVLLDAVEQRSRVGFPDHAGFLLYVENHDEQRYIEECGRDEFEAAVGALFTLPGVPMLYAGGELGAHERRGAIRWADADEDLYAFHQSLVAARAETPALGSRGDFEPVEWDADSPGVVAFAREADGERYVVVLNFGWEAESVSLDEAVDPTDVVSGDSVAADGDADVRVDSVAVLPAR